MKPYRVEIRFTQVYYVEVWANSAEDAEDCIDLNNIEVPPIEIGPEITSVEPA